jgi:hypothetical protein
MKLKQYVQNLHEFIALHPEALDHEVYYSEDIEGNAFDKVEVTPALVYFEDLDDPGMPVFVGEKEDGGMPENMCNAVIIN